MHNIAESYDHDHHNHMIIINLRMRVAPDNAVPNALPFAPAFRFNCNCNHHCGDDEVAGKVDNDDEVDDKDNKD